MRLENRTLGFIINFLLGVAWAFVLIGAFTSFLTFYSTNFFLALLSTLVGAFPGFMGILLLEYFITDREKYEELKKQTKLLQQILEQHK